MTIHIWTHQRSQRLLITFHPWFHLWRKVDNSDNDEHIIHENMELCWNLRSKFKFYLTLMMIKFTTRFIIMMSNESKHLHIIS
jgi:hypothetical protein